MSKTTSTETFLGMWRNFYVKHRLGLLPWIVICATVAALPLMYSLQRFIRSKQSINIEYTNSGWLDSFSALAAVAIGVIMTVVLDHYSDLSSQKIHDAADHIRRRTDVVHDKVQEMLRGYTAVRFVSSYTDILKCIHEIYAKARENKQEILVLNPTASFGYMLTFNAKAILDYARILHDHDSRITWDNLKWGQLKWAKAELQKEQARNWDFLLEYARFIDNGALSEPVKIRYATLSAAPKPPMGSCFLDSYLNLSLQGVRVALEQRSDAAVEGIDDAQAQKTYIVSDDELGADDTRDDLLAFEKFMMVDQRDRMRRLTNAGVDVIEMEEVPFQIFLSRPKPGIQGKCLVMVVNQYSLSKNDSRITAISSDDSEIVGSFINIWQSITEQHRLGGDS